MEIKAVKGTYDSNTFVCSFGKQAIIIDSGATVEDVAQALQGKTVLAILVTHEHFDHLTNCADYARHFQAPIYGSREVLDNLKYYRPNLVLETDGITYPIAQLDENVTFKVIDREDEIQIGEVRVLPYFCPGHSWGSIVYQIQDEIFTGDVLFARGVGNVFMTNGKKYLIQSLQRISQLSFTTAHHGHGEDSDHQGQLKNINVWLKWLSR